MKTTQKRASVGGEFGANGEWYEGGRFINTVPENAKKHGSVARKPRKIQIEPYVWVEVTGDERAIFSVVGAGAAYIDRYDPSKGIAPYMPSCRNGVMYGGETLAEMQTLCDRYNAGERYR
jgi:hypothetical protein